MKNKKLLFLIFAMTICVLACSKQINKLEISDDNFLFNAIGFKKQYKVETYLRAFELWGCALNMILEYKDVSNFVVSEHKVENDTVLTISGLCMHSSYVVKKMYIKKNEDKCSILIKISFF